MKNRSTSQSQETILPKIVNESAYHPQQDGKIHPIQHPQDSTSTSEHMPPINGESLYDALEEHADMSGTVQNWQQKAAKAAKESGMLSEAPPNETGEKKENSADETPESSSSIPPSRKTIYQGIQTRREQFDTEQLREIPLPVYVGLGVTALFLSVTGLLAGIVVSIGVFVIGVGALTTVYQHFMIEEMHLAPYILSVVFIFAGLDLIFGLGIVY